MKIKPMLARLQGTLGQRNLVEQMLLLPEPELSVAASLQSLELTQESINLVVGYTGSPCSQTALDLTFWMAHQTRLATQKQVTVHVVYVVDEVATLNKTRSTFKGNGATRQSLPAGKTERSSTATLTRPETLFEQADRILWQARCLAEEWRGSLNTHLRIGNCAEELKQVAIAESADVLVLGCRSARHPLVSQWATGFPCAVLGIPAIANLDL